MAEEEKDTNTEEKPRTSADAYASFISKQVKDGSGSPFDSRGMKPVSKEDVGKVTGKI